ncbi:type IX secretion system protein PorQ [Crocinitomix algicola]|uniref:type IX secretion system protein PorQ n=1 Tax=Crocinitomix algicola TaxID=1740263 RepID=UPI00082CD47D|nr:type IX secretion system protein PorQ [Crocinitomix algicola]
MKYILLITVIVTSLIGQTQTGGQSTYQFLDLDFNARSLGLGGDFIALKDGDVNLAVANPAAISDKMNNNLSLNHFIYPSGINYGQLAYGKSYDGIGSFVGHLRYVSYGKFRRTDEFGNDQGSFTAGDYSLGIGYGKALNKYFSLGANLNLIFSHLETYTSFGFGVDVATSFYDEESNITATVVARNIGYQVVGYTPGNHESLPIEVLAGVSYKFHHAPFRFSIVGTDLTTWDLTYNDPSWEPRVDELTQDTIPVPSASFAQKLAYHTNFGVEIVPNDNLYFRVGFNYQRRHGLGIIDRKGASGFSFGFGLKTNKFDFNYGLAFYSVAGASNVFGITTNFSKWTRRSN